MLTSQQEGNSGQPLIVVILHMYTSEASSVISVGGQKTPIINGCQFTCKSMLHALKLFQLTQFESKNTFELSTQKQG